MDNALDIWWMFIYYLCSHRQGIFYENKTIFECKCYCKVTVTVSKLALFVFSKLSFYQEARNYENGILYRNTRIESDMDTPTD